MKPRVRNGRGVVEREKYFWRGRKEGILAVVEDDKDVVLERREKDVEAEEERRRRKAVTTSPGFSFSAAGLLFPYYLGVAQLLLDKGYIKVGNSWFFSFFPFLLFVDDKSVSEPTYVTNPGTNSTVH